MPLYFIEYFFVLRGPSFLVTDYWSSSWKRLLPSFKVLYHSYQPGFNLSSVLHVWSFLYVNHCYYIYWLILFFVDIACSCWQGVRIYIASCQLQSCLSLPLAGPCLNIARLPITQQSWYMYHRCLLRPVQRIVCHLASVTTANIATVMGKPKIVFVLGGPGAGKGTQCEKIVKVRIKHWICILIMADLQLPCMYYVNVLCIWL